MEYILFLPVGLSFIATVLLIPWWIKHAKKIGLTGKDVHKLDKRDVVEAGGITVVAGFAVGILAYVGLHVFYFQNTSKSLQIMAVLTSILLVAIIGLIDDILGWKKGLKQWQKPLLTLVAALPIIAINAGHKGVWLPFFGKTYLGLFFLVVLIPIGIMGASNAFNMLAGFNGLEAGLGGLILITLGYISYINKITWVAVISLIFVVALFAFWLFNRYPARIFPGDTLTYTTGVMIAVVAIVGNIEKFALFLFIPYFLEFVLKARGKFKKESFAEVQKDESLKLKDGIYGLEHIAIKLLSKIKKKVYENDVVHLIYLFEIILIVIALTVL